MNGPIWSTDRKVGSYSLNFDGIDDYVDFGFLDLSGSAMTIAAWVRPDNLGSKCVWDNCRIVVKSSGTNLGKTWWMLAVDGTGVTGKSSAGIKFRLRTSGITAELDSTKDVLQDKVWTHVAGVYDGTNMILYADGNEVGRTSKSGIINTDSTKKSWIGAGPPGINDEFFGRLDDVMIYSRALSKSEIQELAGVGGGAVCGNNVVEQGEVCDGNSKSCTINGYSGTQQCNSQCNGWLECNTNQFCGDNSCNGQETCSSCSQDCGICPPTTECSDLIDNADADTLIDLADPGCTSASDISEVDGECDDRVDNDLDSKIDYPADLGCGSFNDNDETNCGDLKCEGGETCTSCSTDCGSCPAPSNATHKECDFVNRKCITIQGVGVDQCQFDSQCVPPPPNNTCGDNICDATIGETCTSCSLDCGSCPAPPKCGNSICEAGYDETCVSCSLDCGQCPTPAFESFFCGDKICDAQIGEGCLSCSTDCGQCVVPSSCGDGDLDINEQCDDGFANSNRYPDSCREDCTLPRCGDGMVDYNDECDDGNLLNGDGCSSICDIEPGFVCVGVYSSSVCGLGGTDTDKDGLPDSIDLCPAENFGEKDVLGRPLPVLTGFDLGLTTDLTLEDIKDVYDFSIGKVGMAEIFFKDQSVDLITGAESDCLSLFVDQLIIISPNFVEVKGELFPTLNKPAEITFYNVNLLNPLVLMDGQPCTSCEIIAQFDTTLIVSVPGFSTYEVVGDERPGTTIIQPPITPLPPEEITSVPVGIVDKDFEEEFPQTQDATNGRKGDIERGAAKVEQPKKFTAIPREFTSEIKKILREPVKYVYENPSALIVVSIMVVMFLCLRTYYNVTRRN